MNSVSRTVIPFATCFAALALVAGCDSSGSSATPAAGYSAGTGSGAQATAGMPGMGTVPGPPALRAARPFDVGAMVVDGQGFSLYRYDKDSASPPRSACEDSCAQVWTPVRSAENLEVTGIDKALVGQVTRTDGSDQLTLAGWPLYRYTKDQMPGETAGQGVGDAWFPLTPDGGKIRATGTAWQANALGI
ncbi:hypothetical protein [Amycolatopsis sp. H20-H5]|uniref:hypothetical protein n=1 Tax=Amycolatopsis sp. H20-H5 TaxID=3046309 RepID=UPI002DB8B8DB|nr:hypothetical protein [Amycolatopsis sp. H20-H5]MEC3976043.1 hypothetical protein [Amycolatopsis sp. H20-H5]